MKLFYSLMEDILPDFGKFLMKKSLWFLYPSLFFLFIDFIAYMKEGMTTKLSLSDFFSIFSINQFYYAEISGVYPSITGWYMIDKYIYFICLSNIGVSLLILFSNILIIGYILNFLGDYCYNRYSEIIWKENKKSKN